MELREPIRIFSDVHLGHPSSLARTPEDLAPLLEGAGTAVFNGDTVETVAREDRAEAEGHLELLRAFCAARGVGAVFLNGNHDPEVSAANHLDLAGGAVLVTHGDALFEDLSPWSRDGAVMGAAFRRELAAMDEAGRGSFEARLKAVKRAALAIEDNGSTLPKGGFVGVLKKLLREAWPPWRALSLMRFWRESPHRAAALAARFRPRARFVVFGHTHYGGVWRIGPRVVVNTGSFLPMGSRTLVELGGRRLWVRGILRRGGGLELGPAVASFEAVPLEPGAPAA